jgi:hypothetical protein
MGAAEQINNEFAQGQRLLPADQAMLIFSIASVGLLCIAVPFLVASKATDKGTILAIHVATITLGYLVAFLLAITGTYSTIRRLASTRNEVAWLEAYSFFCRRAVIGGLIVVSAGLLTGGIWSKNNLGTFWDWNLKEVAGICVLLWYVAFLSWLSFRSEHPKWVPSLAICGGLICVVAWFGANRLATTPFFIVIVVAHLVTLGIALRIFCDRTWLSHPADSSQRFPR